MLVLEGSDKPVILARVLKPFADEASDMPADTFLCTGHDTCDRRAYWVIVSKLGRPMDWNGAAACQRPGHLEEAVAGHLRREVQE